MTHPIDKGSVYHSGPSVCTCPVVRWGLRHLPECPVAIQPPVAETLSERDLQRNVRAMLDQFGWRTNVVHDSRHSPKGWPDIFAVRVIPHGCFPDCDSHPTEAVAIELKSEKGKVSAEQEAWLDLLRRLPGVKFAGVIRPSQWYAGELDDILR